MDLIRARLVKIHHPGELVREEVGREDIDTKSGPNPVSIVSCRSSTPSQEIARNETLVTW